MIFPLKTDSSTPPKLRSLRLARLVSQVEGEYWLVQQLMVDHVVEWRDRLVDGDGIVTKTENTIKSAKGKCEAWLFSCLSKVLVLGFRVTNCDGVLRLVAFLTSRTVGNLER